jgi:hypothetical protein
VLRRGHVDDPLERLDLAVDHDAVRLRHLGREGDETRGEHEIARRRPERRAGAVDQHVARHAAEQGAERAAEGEAQARAAELAPNRRVHAGEW